MTNEYSNTVAKHYAAFRPALHEVILRRLIRPSDRFSIGLDVGCGTGYSAVALAAYCSRVFGLDPNQPMLDKATIHPKISYVKGYGDDMCVLGQDRFDVVSFAGSLSYTKTNKTKSELLRTLALDGVVLVYDFQVFIDDLTASLGMFCCSASLDYNFAENLCDWPEFTSEVVGTDRVLLQLSAQEAAHILLANSDRYQLFQEKFPDTDPFCGLTGYIRRLGGKPQLNADIYFARHSLS
ncbi:MAG: class I SAM-dependent methyltransferase [Desulfobacteraceae bacterium]|nr:class I SAM-dependent methyltransferase [Desulfobacteraceae bacterium]